MFMLAAVPPPPCITGNGNCSCQRPAATSRDAVMMAVPFSAEIASTAVLAFAAAALVHASPTSSSGRSLSSTSDTAELPRARAVAGPYSASTGT